MFLCLFERFKVYYNIMTWNVRKLISPPFQCTSVTNRYLKKFDRFTAYYNCMTWNVQKIHIFCHFSAQVSQIVFLAFLTNFTTYCNCMTWNVRKLISPLFQCTSNTNRVLRLFDRFTAYYNIITGIVNSYVRHFSAQVSQIVFLL